jgi:hypothetical protein
VANIAVKQKTCPKNLFFVVKALARGFFLLLSSLILKQVDRFGHAGPFWDSKCHLGRVDV